jgi:hypothetical protein
LYKLVFQAQNAQQYFKFCPLARPLAHLFQGWLFRANYLILLNNRPAVPGCTK